MKIHFEYNIDNVKNLIDIVSGMSAAITLMSAEDMADITLLVNKGEVRTFKTKGIAITYAVNDDGTTADINLEVDDDFISDILDISEDALDDIIPMLGMAKLVFKGFGRRTKELSEKWTISEDEQEYGAVRAKFSSHRYTAVLKRNEYEGTHVLSITRKDWNGDTLE